MAFIRFPKIGQFKDVIKQVKDQATWKNSELPTLTFTGTVKLHGTNAAVVRNADGSIHFQSRENIITPVKDNAGFAVWASTINWNALFKCFSSNDEDEIAIFGEWCGGNIQKGVALNQLDKMFVIFKAMVNGRWITDSISWWEKKRIFHIEKFQTHTIVIDFNNPGAVQNTLANLTLAVEEKCPVAAHFGANGIGEGIVWTCTTDPSLMFKVKGEKHSASKVKVLAQIDETKATSMQEFADNTITERRLEQGIEFLIASGKELSMKSTGDFIKWVANDILVEEAGAIVASCLEPREVTKVVAQRAKPWFFKRIV